MNRTVSSSTNRLLFFDMVRNLAMLSVVRLIRLTQFEIRVYLKGSLAITSPEPVFTIRTCEPFFHKNGALTLYL